MRFRQAGAARLRLIFQLFADNIVTQFNTLITHKNRWPCNQLPYFMLSQIKNTVIEEQLIDLLISKAKLTEKKVGFMELMES